MAEHSMQERLEDLEARRQEALHAGSDRSVARQHEKGKLLARERIDYLLDPGSFHEIDMLARHRAHEAGLASRPYTDGVITGWGTVDGRKIFLFSQDFTVMGGALGEVFAEKTQKIMDLAMSVGRLWSGSTTALERGSKRGSSASMVTEVSSAATWLRRASSRK